MQDFDDARTKVLAVPVIREHEMDALFVVSILVLTLMTWGLLRLCASLEKRR
jgi:hypothetical protein